MSYPTFPKISRLFRDCVITEKLDGTNALIFIEQYTPSLSDNLTEEPLPLGVLLYENLLIRAGSRKKWLSPDSDNFGFHSWVSRNLAELSRLGPGHHYGEWWGQGIQRGYDLREKRFSLFNTTRWNNPVDRPHCCHVVPELFRGTFSEEAIALCATQLVRGSVASPGYTNPEGLVIFHEHSKSLYKFTLDGDGHKG